MLKYQFMLANSLGGRGVLGAGRGAGADGTVNAQRMRTLEGQVLQAKMESNESKEDAAKVCINPTHARERPHVPFRTKSPAIWADEIVSHSIVYSVAQATFVGATSEIFRGYLVGHVEFPLHERFLQQ